MLIDICISTDRKNFCGGRKWMGMIDESVFPCSSISPI